MDYDSMTPKQLLHNAAMRYIEECTDEPPFIGDKLNPLYFRVRNAIVAGKVSPRSVLEYLDDFSCPMQSVSRIVKASREYQNKKRFISEHEKTPALKQYEDYSPDMLKE